MKMLQVTTVIVLIGSCFGFAFQAHGDDPTSLKVNSEDINKQERDAIVKVWNQYAQCLKTQQFKPCFGLLSKSILSIWEKDHSVTTSEQYAKVKTSEEISFSQLKILNLKKKGGNIMVRGSVRGDGERGKFSTEMEFVFVKESGKWKLGGITEGVTEYLP